MRPIALAVAVLCTLSLASCAPRSAPCRAPATTAAPVPATDAPLPPEDDQLRRWRAIHAADDQVPAGTTIDALLPELLGYLGSPDPARRDGIGYEVLAAWIVSKPQLGADQLRSVTATLVGNLRAPAPAAPDDSVFLRSFSALALSLVAKRDLDAPFFTEAERRDLLAAALDYAGRETDLRGYTGARGWAHAAAHAADLLKFLARQPGFTDDDRALILDAVAALVVRRHGTILHHGEDGRLVAPVMEVVRRGVDPTRLAGFLAALAAPLQEPWPAVFDPVLYAAQQNATSLLLTLFAHLSLEPEPSDRVVAALAALRAVLAG